MRGATGVTIQPRQILRLPRKMTLQDVKENLQKQVKRHFQCGADPTMIRAWSENENANRNPPRKWGYFARSPEAFSIVKYNVLHPILQSNFHQILRLPRKVTLQLHQVLRLPRKVPLERHQVLHLPRKMTRLLYRPHIWNVISNARSNRCHYPTSPNTAPATKNDTARCQRKSPKTGETSFPMRGRSDHDPSMIREWKRKPQPASQVRLLCEVPRSIFYCKIQCFAPNLTVRQTFTKYCACHEKWHYNFTKYCACHEKCHLNVTKYCACHEKWHCKMSKKISKNRWNVISNAGPIRPWSEHDPRMKTQTATRLASEVTLRGPQKHFLL